MDNKELGKRLRMLREERRLPLKDFSKRISYSYNTVYPWENGHHRPSLEALILIADFYNVSLDYLVGRSEERR